ncbi:MAG: hypothetical protein RDU24_15400 [Humidesulfovibrio sp.]|uniref:hypothetical protein n=1 Tax=Humidesulfovibrio sp. TaxID=2910988 RepID=UPI0027FB4E13|nr:hypothetical protein [Humidesulfovibrio sp.]MDQ7836764.1 hypothetical protein [Humidesulfovibrio sp.]
MKQAIWIWVALGAVAALAGLFAAWWGRSRFVRGRRAVIAVSAFLLVGLAGGFLAREPLTQSIRTDYATARTNDLFRTEGLLRALEEAEPVQADTLRQRLARALAATGDEQERAAVEQRLRDEATGVALAVGFSRLGNASDEAAARLAEALLEALKALSSSDASLCLGLLHPGSQTPIQAATLASLRGSVRTRLDASLALVLASSALKPQLAPLPATADAALADMFTENLPTFQQAYGDPKQVQALFEALSSPAQAARIAPDTLCRFAQDLLHALLRMPPAERGPGLRRLLGA